MILQIGNTALEHRALPGTGTPLLLLHEGLGSVGLWRDLPEHLAEATGRPVHAYSRAGYGRSGPCLLPRPLDYMEQEAARVPAVLAACGIDRAILIGHSDGGSIAALAGHLSQVAGLVLIAPHFFVEDCSVQAISEARDVYGTGDLRARLARHHDHVDHAFGGWCDAWLDPGFRDWSITACLDRITAPVLALQGAEDPYGTRTQVDVVAERLPTSQIHLIPGAGHAPHQSHPEHVLPLITDFLAQLP